MRPLLGIALIASGLVGLGWVVTGGVAWTTTDPADPTPAALAESISGRMVATLVASLAALVAGLVLLGRRAPEGPGAPGA